MSKLEAERLFSQIPNGHAQPIKRPSDNRTDRTLREMVEDANHQGDCIINVGRGYYRPLPHDPVDVKEFHEYLNSDRSRVRKFQAKGLAMKMAFERKRKKEEEQGNAEQNNKGIHK